MLVMLRVIYSYFPNNFPWCTESASLFLSLPWSLFSYIPRLPLTPSQLSFVCCLSPPALSASQGIWQKGWMLAEWGPGKSWPPGCCRLAKNRETPRERAARAAPETASFCSSPNPRAGRGWERWHASSAAAFSGCSPELSFAGHRWRCCTETGTPAVHQSQNLPKSAQGSRLESWTAQAGWAPRGRRGGCRWRHPLPRTERRRGKRAPRPPTPPGPRRHLRRAARPGPAGAAARAGWTSRCSRRWGWMAPSCGSRSPCHSTRPRTSVSCKRRPRCLCWVWHPLSWQLSITALCC